MYTSYVMYIYIEYINKRYWIYRKFSLNKLPRFHLTFKLYNITLAFIFDKSIVLLLRFLYVIYTIHLICSRVTNLHRISFLIVYSYHNGNWTLDLSTKRVKKNRKQWDIKLKFIFFENQPINMQQRANIKVTKIPNQYTKFEFFNVCVFFVAV